ncbi:hypothetical protein WN72_35425 [Bradyrhizobium arachidis]|uniref:Iminophenyl-pyruvate dimer synthase domain-containing protein n=2 Tax=Bradyrhizobium arachidis TaxID=858423 RepID=A0AAE7NY30_9BRAD|nr:hypothetical protein WN72_35425 [Bradyrhizobium arachidis]
MTARTDQEARERILMSDNEISARNKIFPRNLTARSNSALERVVGNPANTRLESGVANCFPGLEFDVRTLDNRFFPGLLFRFVTKPLYPEEGTIPNQQGVRLLYIDYLNDPMLPETSELSWVKKLLTDYDANGKLAQAVSKGRWYLDWIEQDGKRLSMTDPQGNYYSCEIAWRFIRGLSPEGELRIGLIRRDALDPKPYYELVGERRRYVNAAGLYDLAYRPGELTESMCNPWSHDFRDCACHYWASNHPDVVIRDVPGSVEQAGAATVYVDWLSVVDRTSTIPAAGTIAQNRLFQIDHYEINQKWEKLPFVLEGREIGREYRPRQEEPGQPYGSDQELIDELSELARMELTLALEYLYALLSLRDPKSAEVRNAKWPGLAADLKVVRDFILLVAVGEMAHLRWANEMLWELDRANIRPNGWRYSPIVELAKNYPTLRLERRLEPLNPKTLDRFIDLERPSGEITRAYSRCVATLRNTKYPVAAYELALRIDGEGTDHYERFLGIKRILQAYGGGSGSFPYLRKVIRGRRDQTECERALELFEELRGHLGKAYAHAAERNSKLERSCIDAARRTMLMFRDEAEDLAEVRGIGVPFWDD